MVIPEFGKGQPQAGEMSEAIFPLEVVMEANFLDQMPLPNINNNNLL